MWFVLLNLSHSCYSKKRKVKTTIAYDERLALNLKSLSRGGARNFPTGTDSSDEGLKYGFQGTINAKNLQKIAFYLPKGG